MKKKKISSVWIIVAAVLVLGIIAWALSGNKKKEEVNFTTEKVAKANIANSITATGTIEPVMSVRRSRVSSTRFMLTTTAP